ncbi:unnamed protein product [Rotaria sordida]|uniref:Uncharacterized protein n=1 Tax=Rotaria sordida TaxID=392033 RepID=A0A818LJD9_9BILA|nr:unnamed protein product [Rotaria sordida]
MSAVTYTNNNNNNNEILQQQQKQINAPPQKQRYVRGVVLVGKESYYRSNEFNYRCSNYRGNQYTNRRNNNSYYRIRNYSYNRNRYNNNNYYYYSGNTFQGRRRSFFRRQQRSRSNRQRRRGPRQIRLNDFMPKNLQGDCSQDSRNLPDDFNLNNAITTAPPDALPQRTIFTNNTNNTTQPFIVNQPNNNLTQQRTNTSSYRRRQRRYRQQQYQHQNNIDYNNRFEILNDINDIDNENEFDNNNDLVEIEINNNKNKIKNKNRNKTKKKIRIYLQPNRILKWFEESSKQSKNAISGRGNQAYTLATTSIYDEWIRNNYELQVWQEYFKLGTEKKLTDEIAALSANISYLQIQLSTYWMHTTSEATTQKIVHTTAELTANLVTTTNANIPSLATTMSTIKNQTREPVDRLEKYILEYLHKCTQHVKKLAENRIQLAKAQMAEYKAFEDFQQIATPIHWNYNSTLKSKIKLWSTKYKNYRTITERIKLDLPPKFISKVDFNFKIDESIISQEEAQVLYNRMREITKNYRIEVMTLYEQTTAREYELLTNEMKQINENFPKTTNEDE